MVANREERAAQTTWRVKLSLKQPEANSIYTITGNRNPYLLALIVTGELARADDGVTNQVGDVASPKT